MIRISSFGLAASGAAALLLTTARIADTARPISAAPEIILFHGGPLAKPVAIASWMDNHHLLSTGEPHERLLTGPPSARESRPSIELALFWGIGWRNLAGSPEQLATLTPAMANQKGRYYPAIAGARAIISVGRINGPVSDSGLAVLRRHGIPTRALGDDATVKGPRRR